MEEYENFDAMHEAARRVVERWEGEGDEDTGEETRGEPDTQEQDGPKPRNGQ